MVFVTFAQAMKSIYLFNPDNDLALAYGGDNYTAPPFARQMQHDLAALPAWFAPAHSTILVPHEEAQAWLDHTALQWRLDLTAAIPQDLPGQNPCRFFPWGWSIPLRHRLLNLGVDAACLPSLQAIEQLRLLSHRRTTIAIHRHLQEVLHTHFSPIPQELSTIDAVMDFARNHDGCYLKSPWSGSGRGIYHVIDAHDPYLENWCKGILNRQGSILCETGLPGTLDFALEFHSLKGEIAFAGYSVFQSDFHSQYSAGTVAGQDRLKKELTSRYRQLEVVKEALLQLFRTMIAPHYEGYFGVDMLFYETGGQTHIDPCVELNLRPTMGIVTCALGNKVLQCGGRGKFKIEYSKNGFPPERKENRIYLTPILEDTRYRAIVDID